MKSPNLLASLLATASFSSLNTFAQVSISPSGADPEPSAMLDVQSTDKGLLIPRMTASQREDIDTPATGLTVFVTDDSRFYFFDGANWSLLGGTNLGNHIATQNLQLNGNWLSNNGASNGLFVDSANKVGIGTSSPAGKLHVFSTTNPLVTFKSDAGSTLILDRGTTSNETAVQFRTGGIDDWLIGLDNAPSGNVSDFAIKKTNNGSPDFVLKANGNVGIGTAEPMEKLEVNGAVKIGMSTGESLGSIRWSGSDFEGWDGLSWKSFTQMAGAVDTLPFNALYGTQPADGVPVQEVNVAAGAGGAQLLYFLANQFAWQSFIAENTGKLTSFEVHHDGLFIETGILRIYEGEGVSGILLHQQPIDDSVTNGPFATYDLNTPLSVTAGRQYTLEIGDTVDDYRVAVDNTNSYPGGLCSETPNWDMLFKTYVISAFKVLAFDETSESTSLADGKVFIDADGNVGINNDTPLSKLHVKDSFVDYSKFVMTVENTGNGSGSGGLLVKAGQNSATGNTRFIQFNRPDGTQIGNIRQDASNSVFFATTSDERLKTLIVPTTFGLHDLMAIDVRDYCFVGDLEHPQTGFIAQQLAQHYPAAVTVGGADPKTDPWQVDYSKLTPLLVKSVQDLKGKVDEQAQQLQSKNCELERLRSEVSSMQSRLEKIEAKLEVTIP